MADPAGEADRGALRLDFDRYPSDTAAIVPGGATSQPSEHLELALESNMIDHVGFSVSDYARAKPFYQKALAPLGYGLVMEVTAQETGKPAAGFGADGKPDFWIGDEGKLEKPVHIAIVAKDRATVDEFYRAALAAGGTDNGPPGLRPHYHPNYYGAFVLDPDGHNIEAVCHVLA